MSRSIYQTIGPFTVGNHSAIALAQSAGATSFVINGALASGGIATLDKARRIVIVDAGNDAGMTATITGTNVSGNTWSETLTLTSAATAGPSVLDYLTVTSITISGTGVASGAVAGTAISGTDPGPLASGPWTYMDSWALNSVALQVNVTGTVNYTVQSSLDDPNLTRPQTVVPPSAVNWYALGVMTSATTTSQASFGVAPVMVRLTINTATATTSSATFDIVQAGGGGLA